MSLQHKGGYDGMKNLSTVEMYNPETNEWSFVASMEKHEGGVGVGVIPMDEWYNCMFLSICTGFYKYLNSFQIFLDKLCFC